MCRIPGKIAISHAISASARRAEWEMDHLLKKSSPRLFWSLSLRKSSQIPILMTRNRRESCGSPSFLWAAQVATLFGKHSSLSVATKEWTESGPDFRAPRQKPSCCSFVLHAPTRESASQTNLFSGSLLLLLILLLLLQTPFGFFSGKNPTDIFLRSREEWGTTQQRWKQKTLWLPWQSQQQQQQLLQD